MRRWWPWAAAGMLALSWGYYSAPTRVAKGLRSAAAETEGSPVIASRVDFARVDAGLSGDLRTATGGRLDEASFAHLLRYGWLPQQKRSAEAGAPAGHRQEINPVPATISDRNRQTVLTQIRYKGVNRFVAIFWDVYQMYEVVLTLERESVFGRWRVTGIRQINTCAGGYGCPQVPLRDLVGRTEAGRPNN